MPIQCREVDVISQMDGLQTTLIVPCNMCPAVSVSVRENKPFMKFFGNFMKSEPFEQYIRSLQDRLKEKGVRSQVFRNPLPHQWFLCMWTAGRQKKLRRYAKQFDSVIVLGCDSACQTVKDSVKPGNCKVISGMKVAGIMNATLTMDWTGAVSFKNCRLISLENQGFQRPDHMKSF